MGAFHTGNYQVHWTPDPVVGEPPSVDELAGGTDLTEYINTNEEPVEYEGIVQSKFQLYGYTHIMGETFRTTERWIFDELVNEGVIKPVPDEDGRFIPMGEAGELARMHEELIVHGAMSQQEVAEKCNTAYYEPHREVIHYSDGTTITLVDLYDKVARAKELADIKRRWRRARSHR